MMKTYWLLGADETCVLLGADNNTRTEKDSDTSKDSTDKILPSVKTASEDKGI